MSMCIYNCGREARFELKNGNPCCSEKHHQCEGWRNKRSIMMKTLYKDPEFYNKQCANSKEVHSRPEVKQKKHDAMIHLHRDPENLDFQIKYKNGKSKISGENHYRYKNGGGYVYWHIRARKLFLKDHCENCGKTLIELKEEFPTRKVFLHIHCTSDNFRNLVGVNFETLCPSCHGSIQKRIRKLHKEGKING